MAPSRTITCTKCKAPLPAGLYNVGYAANCGSCGSAVRVEVFPALFRERPAGNAGEAIVEDSQASCFYHAGKKAAVHCDACGRFLCGLCDIQLGERHVCPACVADGKRKGKLGDLETRRILYDSIALSLVVFSLLVPCVAIVAAPAAILVAIAFWNKPSSIPARGKSRFVVALLLGALEIAACILALVLMIAG